MTSLNLKTALGVGDLNSVIEFVNSQEFNALDENVYFKYIDEIAEMLDDLPSLTREDVSPATSNSGLSQDKNNDDQWYQIHEMRKTVAALLVNVVNNVREPGLWSERASDVGRLLVECLDMHSELPLLSSTLWNIWLADRTHTERALLEFGLMSPVSAIRLASIQELSRWVKEMNGRIAFRKFTFAVVRLLQDSDQAISNAAYALLVQFFSSAKQAAKDDLFNIVQRLQLPQSIVSQLEQGINDGAPKLERPGTPQATVTTPEKAHLPAKEPLVADTNRAPIKESLPPQIPRSRQPSASRATVGAPQVKRTPSPAASAVPAPVSTEPIQAQTVDVPGQYSAPDLLKNPSFDFLKDKQYPMQPVDTPKNPPYSLEQAYTELQPLLRFFNGKETEDNWTMRMNAVKLLRYMVQMASSPPLQQELYVLREAFRIMQRGLGEAVLTMRTVLAAESCQCIKDYAQFLSKSQYFLDLFQPLLDPVVKTAVGVKKITAHAANLTLCAIFYESPVVSPRMFTLIERESKSTKAQARAYSYVWLTVSILLSPSSLTNRRGEIISIVTKAVGDATPTGRTRGRELYWAFSVSFPDAVSEIDRKISPSARRALENNFSAAPSISKKLSPMKSQPTMRQNTMPTVSPIRPNSQPSIHRPVSKDWNASSQKPYNLRLSNSTGSDSMQPMRQRPSVAQKPLKLASTLSPMKSTIAQPDAISPRRVTPKLAIRKTQSKTEDEYMDENAVNPLNLTEEHNADMMDEYQSDRSVEFEDERRNDFYLDDSSSQSGEVVQSLADLSMEEAHISSSDQSSHEESPKQVTERPTFIRPVDEAFFSSSPTPKKNAHESTPLKVSSNVLERNVTPLSHQSQGSIGDSFNTSASDSINSAGSQSHSKITPDSSGASIDGDDSFAQHNSKVGSSPTLPKLPQQQRPKIAPIEQLAHPRISSDDVCPFPESPSMCKAKINSILERIRTFSASAEELAALAVLIAASSIPNHSKSSPLFTAASQWSKSYQYDMELRDSILPYIEKVSANGAVQNTSVGLILLRCLLNTSPDASYKDVYLQPSDCLNCLFSVAQQVAPQSFEIADHLLPDIGQLLLADHRLNADTLVEILCSQFRNDTSSCPKVLAMTLLKRALSTHCALLEESSDSVVQLLLRSLSDDDVTVRKDAYPVLALIHHANSSVSQQASSQMNDGQRYLLNHYLSCV